MRTFIVLLIIFAFHFACLTVDPERPGELLAPTNLKCQVVNIDSVFQKPGEHIKITWTKNPLDTISVSSYTIIRSTDNDSNISSITNIPFTVTTFYDPTGDIYDLEERVTEKPVIYSVYGVDSLGRQGDTTELFTVHLAPATILSTPGETIHTNDSLIVFKWFVRKIQDQTISKVSLWKNSSILWSSIPESLYTGGDELTSISRTLPAIHTPMDSGSYHWSVSLEIINGRDNPISFTFKDLDVLPQ